MSPSPAILRYAVLHHEQIPEPHYDLLFESEPGSMLMAVRCTHWPPTAGMHFKRIPHHRPVYLDYEGPVSDNRGTVCRVAGGTCSIEPDQDESLLLRLDNGLSLRIPRAPWD